MRASGGEVVGLVCLGRKASPFVERKRERISCCERETGSLSFSLYKEKISFFVEKEDLAL